MNKGTVLIVALGLLVAVSSCGSRAGKDIDNDKASRWEKVEEKQLCGGYQEQREISEEEMALFRSVTGRGDMVLTPLSVSTQIVSGINYKFWCRYEDKENKASGHCWVVIYRNLAGVASLTSITKEEATRRTRKP